MQERRARLRDVAEAAGVSQGTASNVFNRPEVVREEVRERVLEAARALGYSGPSPQGRLLRAGRANAVGVAAAEPLSYFFADPWARRLMAEVARACDARGAGLALVSMAGGEGDAATWGIESALVDGFLLRCGGRELLVEVAQRRGLPFVALSLDQAEPDVPAVDIDDRQGAMAVARHVAALGHRRAAILGIGLGPVPRLMGGAELRATRFVNVRERALGFWEAMAEVGVAEAEVPVLAVSDSGDNLDAGLDLLLDRPDPPTALLAMSDQVALAAMARLARRGVRVPEAMSVTGFDGVPEGLESRPTLTTVEQPFRAIAERSVAAILDRDLPDGREVLPLALVVRGSTGPAPG